MLLKDEKNILKWLSDYGPLPEALVISMLFDKEEITAKQIIRNLQHGAFIARRKDGLLGIDTFEVPDDRNITALWVLTEFIADIQPGAHRPAEYPAQVYFLKEQYGYEIVVIKENESRYLGLLNAVEEMKYIIVAPDPKIIDTDYFPKNPCIIAKVEFKSGDRPEILLYGG